MNLKKAIIAGICGGIVNVIYSMTICTRLITPWLKGVTGEALWKPETGLYLPTMIVFGFAICILWALGYALLYKGIPGTGLMKGVAYGIALWLLGLLPHTTALYLHTTISPEVIWVFLTANGLFRGIVLGLTFAAIYKEKTESK